MYLTADGVEMQDGDRVFPMFGYEAMVGTDDIAAGVEYYSTPLAAKVARLARLHEELDEVRETQARLLDQIVLLQGSIFNDSRVAEVIRCRPARMPAALTTES